MSEYECGFTFNHYRHILKSASRYFEFSSFKKEPDDTRRVYLRHDIDVSVKSALKIAEIEANIGVKSTYFVATNSPYYNLFNDTQLKRIHRIKQLGHTIGFHADERATYINPFDTVEEAISSTYDYLERVVPIEPVISFHMPSDYDFQIQNNIGKFINVYSEKFNNKHVKYLSDSGRNWREGCFCGYIGDKKYHSFQILIHPIWWNENNIDPKNIYRKIATQNKKGLRVNLKNDIEAFKNI